MPERDDEIGALWAKTSAKGVSYMTGTVNGAEVVLFPAKHDNPNAPSWRVYKSKPKGDRPGRQCDD